MKTLKNITYIFAAILVMVMQANVGDAAVQAPQKPAVQKAADTVKTYTTVLPVDVVNNPAKYLNKDITFTAEFVAFTSLGLDYKPAFRDGSKYIGILIKRDDVKDHVIPLSEMKIFITREAAEKHIDVEAGDKIKISGNVFSNALGDVWVDANVFDVLTQKSKKEDKK